VKQRTVVFSPEASDDIIELYDWIERQAGSSVAIGYIARIHDSCLRLGFVPEQGRRRGDIRRGLRITGFEDSGLLTWR
jgi:toxin ParE1/3/4